MPTGWSDEEIARRWGRLYPPRDKKRKVLPVSDEWVQQRMADAAVDRHGSPAIAEHQLVHEMLEGTARSTWPIGNETLPARFSRNASRVWQSSMKQALFMIATYIDLNRVAAGLEPAPETSSYTSIKQRVEHVEAQGRTADLAAAQDGSVAGSVAASGLEEALWLCPIEDRRGLDSTREGMIQGFSLGSYLLLVDYTGRLFRHGKAVMSAELAGIFDRLGCTAEKCQAWFFGASRC